MPRQDERELGVIGDCCAQSIAATATTNQAMVKIVLQLSRRSSVV